MINSGNVLAIPYTTLRGSQNNVALDTKACNSAEEILEINEEILDLSATSNLVSRNTSYVSVDSQSRQVLNSLPIILCRPENNRTQFSSVVSKNRFPCQGHLSFLIKFHVSNKSILISTLAVKPEIIDSVKQCSKLKVTFLKLISYFCRDNVELLGMCKIVFVPIDCTNI